MIVTPPVVRTPGLLRARVMPWREAGERIGMVVVAGPFHAGCQALIAAAKTRADRLLAGVLLDAAEPMRDEMDEAARLIQAGADLVYAPQPEPVANDPISSSETPGTEDEARIAAATVRLLIQAAPDVAVFGETHWRRLVMVRRMMRELGLAVQVDTVPAARADDGTVLCSSAARLGPEQRAIAARLHAVLRRTATAAAAGADPDQAEAAARAALLDAGFDRVDRLEIRGADDLRRFAGRVDAPARVLAEVRLGGLRLIDNLSVE